MELRTSDRDGVHVLHVVGNYDTTEIEGFDAYIESAVDHQQFKVLVDAEKLRFITSAALGSLIRAQKRLQEFGGDLAVVSLPSFAAKVFATLGLDQRIRCFATNHEAVSYMRDLRPGGKPPGA